MKTIGVITDIHGTAKIARRIYSKLRKSVDAIILAGDIADTYEDILKVLKIFSRAKFPVYVIPGSHEPPKQYRKAIRQLKGSSIVDCFKKRKVSMDDLDLVFLPGSDVLAHEEGYRLVKDKRSKQQRREVNVYVNDVAKLITRKETLLISHVPPKFRGKFGIDHAHFGLSTKPFIYTLDGEMGVVPKKGHIVLLHKAKKLAKAGCPVKIHQKNVGTVAVSELIKRTGIKFFVSGHIHEAGGRAVTRGGKKIRPNTWSKQAFYNPGPGFKGRAGIITFKDGKMKYKNLKV